MTLYQVIRPVRGGLPWYINSSSWDYPDDEYYMTMRNAVEIDESIARHIGILKREDGNRNVKIAVDEWGTWYKDEAGGPIWYMLSTMRDALVQAAVLNIFNKHSDVLMLCNLGMTVNALSSLILTSGEKMIKNPPFYVFKMYKEHQDSTLIYSYVDNETIEFDGIKLPCVSYSVSIKDGKMLITLVNCMLDRDYNINCRILYENYTKCEAEILHSDDVRMRNTFDNPDIIKPEEYKNFTVDGENLQITLPRCSVMALRLS